MVKIAFAGGSGNVGSEIIDVLVATKKHDIVILTRSVNLPIATSFSLPMRKKQMLIDVFLGQTKERRPCRCDIPHCELRGRQ